MNLKHGFFEERSISVIASDTVGEMGRLAGRSLDVFSWAEGDDPPAVTVTMRDVRCSMLNLNPDSASPAPEVMKTVVRANQNHAGIYGTVTRIGRLAVGQTIFLHAAAEKRERGCA